MKQYKFQNRSQKNSHSCVPLNTGMKSAGMDKLRGGGQGEGRIKPWNKISWDG